jgi:hypothetical protein
MEEETGPTGPTGPIEQTEPTGPSGPTGETGPTGSSGFIGNIVIPGPSDEVLALFPSANTVTIDPPHIVTIDELMSSYSAVLVKEANDKSTLSILKTPTRDAFRTQLFQWATLGFPSSYVIQQFTVTPPAVCSDGVTREIGKYIEYCLGFDLGVMIEGLSALMTGIQPAWSIDGNTLMIRVSRV